MKRDHRLLRAGLDPDEGAQEGDADQDQAPDAGVAPVTVLRVGQPDQDRDDADGEGEDAGPVDGVRRVRSANGRQQAPDDEERQQADGDVDVEDPVPAEVVGQQAPEPGTDQEGDAEDRAEQALVLAPLARGEEVADDGEADREERPGAEALDAPEEDQLPHLLREAGEGRSHQEEPDAHHEHGLAAEEVGELAVDRHRDGAGHQVAGGHPDVEVGAVQGGDDLGQDGPDDRLVEGREEEAEHDGPEDLEAGAWADVDRRILCGTGLHGHLRLADGHESWGLLVSRMEVDWALVSPVWSWPACSSP